MVYNMVEVIRSDIRVSLSNFILSLSFILLLGSQKIKWEI